MGLSSAYGLGSIRTGVCTSTTRPASPFVGQTIFETDTGNTLVWKGSSWSGVSKMKNVTTFTASGTFTPPTGVTYAIAYIKGGGGGMNNSGAGAGGTSSVAFASGTVSATGGAAVNAGHAAFTGAVGTVNSGLGARAEYIWPSAAYTQYGSAQAGDGATIVAGAAVTAGVGISVTVGSGGTGGTGVSGGSGYVYIEYEV